MENVGQQQRNVSLNISHNQMEPQATNMNFSTLSLKRVNKCCPDHQHYIEDESHRIMCGNVSMLFNAISIGREGYQFLQEYSCETSFGMYVNNFEKLEVNGLGYVTYKKKIYPRSCIDYDTKRQRWIIMECTMGKHVVRTKQVPTTSIPDHVTTETNDGLKSEKELDVEEEKTSMMTTTEGDTNREQLI